MNPNPLLKICIEAKGEIFFSPGRLTIRSTETKKRTNNVYRSWVNSRKRRIVERERKKKEVMTGWQMSK